MLRKYATAQILDAVLASADEAGRVRKMASRAVFDYEPREGYLYVRSRAISSRCNDNFDEFPAEEIAKGYRTFLGKPVFVNHHNEDHRRARGFIIDAALHRDTNPDGTPDTWAELLQEVDAKRFPVLAKAILAGEIDRTSMGVDVAFSVCAVCNNKATAPRDYCQHIPGQKGSRVYRHTAGGGPRVGELVRERCYGLKFFENSLLVEQPADPTAFFTGVEAGPGVKTASKVAVNPMGQHKKKHKHDGDSGPRKSQCRECGGGIYLSSNGNWIHDLESGAGVTHMGDPGVDADGDFDGDTGDNGGDSDDGGSSATASLMSFEAMFFEAENAGDRFLKDNPVSADHIVHRFLSATPEEHDSGMHWYEDSHNVAKAIGGGDAKKAAGLMGVYSAGTPVAPNYHYASRALMHNAAIGGPKENGLPEGMKPEHNDFHGHPNANLTQAGQARRILDGEHHSTVLKSPKVSNYAHLIEHGDNEIDHKGPERVVVDRHAVSAAIGRRITDDEFGALGLSNNQTRTVYQKDEKGKRVKGSDGKPIKHVVNDYGDDMNAKYQHIANSYREATRRLREMGHDVKAHQVQAVAWGVQKRMNDAEDEQRVKDNHPTAGNIKGRQNSQRKQRDAWEAHERENYGGQASPENPRGHWGKRLHSEDFIPKTAYGETKAPPDVDTLRDSDCPVCGESSSMFDGQHCQVCGFDAPPKMLQDPDLDMARRLDLRKDVVQDALGDGASTPVDPSGQPMQGGQQVEQMEGEPSAPIDPDQVDQNGDPIDQANLDPQVDQAAAGQQVNQGGEPFTPGPNAPQEQQPMDPMELIDPSQVDDEGNPVAPDGQAFGERPGEGQPGTPDDGVPDLVCPACGFEADASQPQTVDMDGGGQQETSAASGDPCPNCGQGQMISVRDLQQADQAMQMAGQ